MITEHPRHQSLAAIRGGAALRFRTPLHTRTRLAAIHGPSRVEAVELADLDTGRTSELACDLVIFTADWIPDHELAVLGEAVLDRATGGPSVDPALRTTRAGVFAAGNLLQGAETADVAALNGRHVAAGVIRYLEGEPWPTARIPIRCEAPLGWISPNALTAGPSHTLAPPRGRFLLRSGEALSRAVVELSQDGRQLWRGRLRRIGPGRSDADPADWTRGVDALGGPVFARLLAARRPVRRAQVTSAGMSAAFDAWEVELHGHRVIYRIAGSGPPVVLIHGMVNSSRHWEAVALRLADGPHGDRPRPDRPRRLGDAARRLLARRPRGRDPRPARRDRGRARDASSATRWAAASRCSSSTSSPSASSGSRSCRAAGSAAR